MNEPEPDYNRAHDFFANRYVERGMLKWQGYYLSDHTSALNKEATDKQPQQVHERQSSDTVRELLADAYANQYMVSIQRYPHNSDKVYAPDLTGHISGTTGDAVVLDTGQPLMINDIRHVKLIK
ncbi:hypothetical protein [Furfurilactobacillus siliginis]|uniref:DNA-directed RNA polymerase beta subunit n=1 Tax=Furfurilactobacillus siliginis TaxID=348151 RepID=A0A0R2KYU2_9LACO|nr:hypothetical protein [Furfurilactobacillus siliginis]KRN94703.1 hypothetical protein IV55_GL000473 [Furfurilactobacillus siliginis]GEK28415.1 hypothetical protein LSI01_07260 [Furfurilactobacillus siliginis]